MIRIPKNTLKKKIKEAYILRLKEDMEMGSYEYGGEEGQLGMAPEDIKQQYNNQWNVVADLLERTMDELASLSHIAAEMADMEGGGAVEGELGKGTWEDISDLWNSMDQLIEDKWEPMLSINENLEPGANLDPIGQEDLDINNDMEVDDEDQYLHNRRRAIARAMAGDRDESEDLGRMRRFRQALASGEKDPKMSWWSGKITS